MLGRKLRWGKHARKKYGKYKICGERIYSYWVSGLVELSLRTGFDRERVQNHLTGCTLYGTVVLNMVQDGGRPAAAKNPTDFLPPAAGK